MTTGKRANWTGARFPVPKFPLCHWSISLIVYARSRPRHRVVFVKAAYLFFNKGSTNLVPWVFSALLENEKTLGTRLREARRRCARGFIGIRKIRSRRFPFPLCFSSSPWPRCGSSLQRSIDDRVQMKRRLGRVKYASDQL